MNSEGWSAKSSRVMTAFTPGRASALEVSIDTMRAWGCGLRSTRPISWPGRLKSAPKRARPVTLSTPSGRMVRVPTTPCPFVPFSAIVILSYWASGRLRRAPAPDGRRISPAGRAHGGSGVFHRAHDLVVARAPAEIAGQPVADLGVARVRVALQQRAAGHEEAGGADPALQRRVLEELLLQRVQRLAPGHALDGLDPAAVHLAAQHEARAHQPAVERDAAGAAVTRGAAFLAAGEVQRVAQHVEQRLLRLAEELHRVAVHRRRDVMLGHYRLLARSSAISAARRASTPATWMRNSTVPRLSSIGAHAARAAASRRSCAGLSRRLPTMAAAASRTSSTRGATAPSDTRASVIVPPLSMVTLTPAPTTAMSISVRGMKRR